MKKTFLLMAATLLALMTSAEVKYPYLKLHTDTFYTMNAYNDKGEFVKYEGEGFRAGHQQWITAFLITKSELPNPLNISWIVGLGERTIRAPLHNSRYNPGGMCVPGQQAQGPNRNGQGYNYGSTVYPPHDNSFAVMHAFVDCHWAIAMDEGTVIHQAETMAAFGLLLKDR